MSEVAKVREAYAIVLIRQLKKTWRETKRIDEAIADRIERLLWPQRDAGLMEGR